MRRRTKYSAFATAAVLFGCSGEQAAPDGLPTSLPFELARQNPGTPTPVADVDAFTREVTGTLETSRYFSWIVDVSHGMHASTGKPDFTVFWHNIEASKEGDLVTFRHSDNGGAHNIYIPTPRILSSALGAHLLDENPAATKAAIQFSKGMTAAAKGMVWDDADPNRYLMARNFVAQNHEYALPDGRRKAVDYSPWFNTYEDWNAHRIRFPNNPYWGDVYVTNMRSKDDVPHMFLAIPMLRYAVERTADDDLRAAAAEALEHLEGFARDIVDSGYLIRTKDADGEPFVPDEDLASFVTYEFLIPNAECTAKISSAFIAYGDPRGNDCGRADGNDFESLATSQHYYNYAIVDHFHLSAAWNALLSGQNEMAARLLRGIAFRLDRYLADDSEEVGRESPRWNRDMATYLLRSAAAGLPLTRREVDLIHSVYREAFAAYATFENWDLWSDSVPDGTYPRSGGIVPNDEGRLVKASDLALFFEYCASPVAAQSTNAPINCEILSDRAAW